MFADAILLLAHTVSAMRYGEDILFICQYAVDYDVKFNSNKLRGRPTICPHPFSLDLLILKVVSESYVMRATSVLF